MTDKEKKVRASLILKALKNRTKLKILQFIHSRTEVWLKKIWTDLNLCQPNVAAHLITLHQLGLVKRRKVWKNVFYKINYEKFESIRNALNNFHNGNNNE